MKLQEIYIKINGKSEVEAIKSTLELLGEKIYQGSFYNGHEKQLGLHRSGSWWCSNGYEDTHTEISIKELICMICDKPKFETVYLFNGMVANVYGDEMLIKDADKTVTTLRPSDLEDMLHAYKSLQ